MVNPSGIPLNGHPGPPSHSNYPMAKPMAAPKPTLIANPRRQPYWLAPQRLPSWLSLVATLMAYPSGHPYSCTVQSQKL